MGRSHETGQKANRREGMTAGIQLLSEKWGGGAVPRGRALDESWGSDSGRKGAALGWGTSWLVELVVGESGGRLPVLLLPPCSQERDH